MLIMWWRKKRSGLTLAFAGIGLLAAAGAVVYPDSRTVLFALSGTFLFAATLVGFLRPERYVRATVSESIYTDLAANEAALIEAYDLQNTQIYVPRNEERRGSSEETGRNVPARLFVPQDTDYGLPSDVELESVLVTSNADRGLGLSLVPCGSCLFREFESMLSSDLSGSPDDVAVQLADGATEGFELADHIRPDVNAEERRITFDVVDSIYGPVDRLDHPLQSFLSIGVAVGLDRPVVAETTVAEGRSDYVITCRWGVVDRVDDEQTGGSQSLPLWPGRWAPKNSETVESTEPENQLD